MATLGDPCQPPGYRGTLEAFRIRAQMLCRHAVSELDDRYERGQETRRMFGGGQISGGSSPGAWDIAPDLERILGEALFGTIWKRPALTPVQREMVTLSCLIVMNREVQLKRHLGNALNAGLTPDHVVELIIHDAWYGGAPAGIQALTLCKEVFEERGIEFTPNPHPRCQRRSRQPVPAGRRVPAQLHGNHLHGAAGSADGS